MALLVAGDRLRAARARRCRGRTGWRPLRSASTAAAITDGGPSSSGKPWPRLTDPVRTASADISREDRGRDALRAGAARACRRRLACRHGLASRGRPRPWPPTSTRCCRLTGEFTLRSGPGGRRVLRQVPLRVRAALLRAGGRARWCGLLPDGHRAARRPRARRHPDRHDGQRRTGLPALFVRKKAKEYGTCKLAEGPDVAGRRVTLDRGRDHDRRRRTRRDPRAAGRRARGRGRGLRDRPQPRRARTRSPTSASRCARCSPRPSWTPLAPADVGLRDVAVGTPVAVVVGSASAAVRARCRHHS